MGALRLRGIIEQQSYSSAKTFANSSGEIRKPAVLIRALIASGKEDKSPSCFARSKIPKTPVTFNPSDLAILRPSRSSSNIRSALRSIAKVIASDSPRPLYLLQQLH